MYVILSTSLFAEAFILYFNLPKGLKIAFSGFIILASSMASAALFMLQPSIASSLLILIALVRAINVARIIEARMQVVELRRRASRTFMVTFTSTVLVAGYMYIFDEKTAVTIYLLLLLQLVVAVLLMSSVIITRAMYRYRPSKIVDEKIPTVSVCIPARNETQDLPACIESILASTYPKLEILVLDDCSHDKTPEIIKGYAHAGVRFINGKEPRDEWLAKNAAYDRLADEARGDILIFVGVDVRLNPDSIAKLVGQMGTNDMLSVLPRRGAKSEAAFFIQPIRYWWELGLWRFSRKNPPVLSTLWAMRADTLRKLGTFESVKKAVEPEAVLAHRMKQANAYSFLIANHTVGVTSIKRPKDQYQTALRKRYPQLKRRPERVMVVILFEVIFLLMPYLFAAWFIFQGEVQAASMASVSVILLSIANAEVYKLSLERLWPLGFVSVPTLAIADGILMLRSLYAYEFNEVIWKERNICLPLLKVEKSLPTLDK